MHKQQSGPGTWEKKVTGGLPWACFALDTCLQGGAQCALGMEEGWALLRTLWLHCPTHGSCLALRGKLLPLPPVLGLLRVPTYQLPETHPPSP